MSAKSRSFSERLCSHGRKDELVYYQMPIPEHLAGRATWHGMRTIGDVVRMSERREMFTSDDRYSIISIANGHETLPRLRPSHWSIENSLHWCLDVTFREDDRQVRNRTLAATVTRLKRFTSSLLKQVNDNESVAMRRRIAGLNPDYLLKLLKIHA